MHKDRFRLLLQEPAALSMISYAATPTISSEAALKPHKVARLRQLHGILRGNRGWITWCQ